MRELDLIELERDWPYHIALPAAVLRSASEAVYAFIRPLSVAPRPWHFRRNERDFVVFCFARPQDAQAFAERFGAKVLPR